MNCFNLLIQVADKVLKVNGHSVVDVDHYTAVEILKSAGNQLVLLVTRDVPRLVPLSNSKVRSM